MAYFIDDFHAFHHGAEDRVAPAGWTRVQIQVVRQIDVELCISRVRIIGSRESDRTAHIAESITGFIDDRSLDWFELIVLVVAACLRNKALDHTMKDRALIVAFVDVFKKVLDRKWCALSVELDDEAAESRYDLDAGIGGLRRNFLSSRQSRS